ncbi:hypothetical protein GCM10007242_46120 [Pigmentiphaga litoralis]|jgi:hypothetical protein|uniref:hypothetical protein n=1 Tax=Pigmentiphaga litoralis TaxID=516702 RepID=UPI001676F6B3|nr:hypothetical protein [Pigmentiphaga litoralis]GGX33666.1 hypothetical protein GCM10007242_46120 [Pigmentiphaga litoralis]
MTEKTASHPATASTATPLPPLNQRNARPPAPVLPRGAKRTVAPARRGNVIDTTTTAKPRKSPPKRKA